MLIPIDKIIPNPQQPREQIDAAELESLADNIRQHGLLNAIAVEKNHNGYILIDGERRWRACALIGMTEIEAVVRESSDDVKKIAMALSGNMQRADMNPIETAHSFEKLRAAGYSAIEIGAMINRDPGIVNRYLGFLKFPDQVQELYRTGKLHNESNGLAALSSIKDPKQQVQIATMAARRGLSGVAIANLVKRMKIGKPKQRKSRIDQNDVEKWPGHWNMIAQSGVKTFGDITTQAAEKVCMACVLYEAASDKNCRDCPGAQLLAEIAKANGGGKTKVMEAGT